MTPEIAIVLSILAASIVLLITEWIPMEVVALLVLGSLAISGIVNPPDALSGFSNPAVVTVWAVFILSGGLTRTGVANIIGRHVLRLAGRTEVRIIVVIMLSAGVMSAFMNNVAVAALMLPVVMDIARRTDHPPSRLLMPLAFGSLLGGLTTLIGTPPNILVSIALRENGLAPFKMFDFTPIGGMVMLAGIAFMALVGRHLLPKRDVAKESSAAGHLNLMDQYDLRERTIVMRVPSESLLVGKTLAESRLGSALGLHVVGIIRDGRTQLAPNPSVTLHAEDRLLVDGRLERMNELSGWRQLAIEKDVPGIERLFSDKMGVAEARLAKGSLYVGQTLREIEFRSRLGLNVVAIRRAETTKRSDLQDLPLEVGDALLVQGPRSHLEEMKGKADFVEFKELSQAELRDVYQLHERLIVLRVPQVSILMGKTLAESRLGDALGMRVLSIVREDGTQLMPERTEQLMAGDILVVAGKADDFQILQGLEALEIQQGARPAVGQLESERVGLLEAVLSPRSILAGKTLRQLNFREKYGLSVLAIWREGKAYSVNLRDMALRFGDALLLYGSREKLVALGREADFLVLTGAAQEVPRIEKSKLAALLMCGVVLSVILGFVPISIAAVVGAALMVLTRCLTMEEAYRFIEWKAIFLIAGMLPLGTALEKTGAAKLLADGVVTVTGPFGSMAVIFGLVALTFFATCIIPTAALVVLMAPIVLNAASDMGVSPHAMMMGVAMAASSSFTSPVAHPANVLVMGPGGYRFADYVKVGVPLTLVVLLVVLLVLPVLWPLSVQ